MESLQLLVTNSPFSEQQIKLLNELLPTLAPNQAQWLSGYLAFSSNNNLGAVPVQIASAESGTQAVQVAAVKEATVLFGSQTGNAQRLANRLSEQLKQIGYSVVLSPMNKYKATQLKDVKNLFILVSTHGEGEPPDNAKSFYEFLYSKRAPKLAETQFSVLALGDTSYEFFCKTGQDFESRLEELGAKKLADRADCDVDFEAAAAGWIEAVVEKLNSLEGTASVIAPSASGTGIASVPASSVYTRQNPFQAEILESINLSGRGSGRVTTHLELSLEGSNLTYAPGDAVGIIPHNDENLAKQIIAELGFTESENVILPDKQSTTLLNALVEQLDITTVSKPLLEKFNSFTSNEKLSELLKSESSVIKGYTYGRDLLDLVKDYKPWSFTASEFVGLLRKIPSRLYSIASSIKAHPDEVHLTIRKVEYEAHGRKHEGVCSSYVADRVEIGDKISIFVQENPNFKLPQNNDAPIILIGPGTGVAPFRAFLEEREELGAQGKSWLFFGDRNYVTDFLYQTDWQRMLQDGVLTNLEVAFSRDTEEKVYVQHRLKQHAAELYAWIEEGAYIYICGDEKYMAHDVHKALIDIISQYKAISEQEAEVYLQQLQDDGRYQRDVY